MITINQKFGKTVAVDTANVTYSLANVQVSGETVSGMTITKIVWSTNNVINIKRGANTYCKLFNAGQWDLAAMGMPLTVDSAADVVIEIPGTGSTIIEINKLTNNATVY